MVEKNYRITMLPGDGIGPEMIKQAYKILDAIQTKFKIKINTAEKMIGGIAINHTGHPLPEETLQSCQKSDAILLGAVGGPQWKHLKNSNTPEQGGLLALRKKFNLFTNIRPIFLSKELKKLSPLNSKYIPNGFDVIFVRELIGGIYFGPKGKQGSGSQEYAFDTAVYHRFEIERIAHFAFKLAKNRRKNVISIDKSNVLQTSVFWREIVSQVAESYPDINIKHLYIDNASMELIKNISMFDVILCPNMFGDILSDECAMLSGSIGMLPSASLNEDNFGVYEPAGGSAPDIAGKNIANPIAQILSIALLFRYSLKLNHISIAIEEAVHQALILGYRTIDIVNNDHSKKIINTDEMGNIIASLIHEKRDK